MLKGMTAHSVLACVALALCASAFSAYASVGSSDEDASTANEKPSFELTEVTVTARRRSEVLQDVPASITVLDAQTIENAGIHSLEDLSRFVPNLNFFQNYRAGQPFITMRGVPTAQGGEPPVTVLVDGVQAPGLEYLARDLVDVADIQVLRGPQGALYGRGAVAGAVIVETKKPTDDLTGDVRGYFGNGQSSRASGSLSGPLSPEVLWFRVSGSWRNTEGFNPNDTTGGEADPAREYGGQFELLAQPVEALALALRVAHTQGRDGALDVQIVSRAQFNDFSIHTLSNFPPIDHRDLNSASFKVDWTTAFGTLTSISQLAKSTSHILGDADFTSSPIAEEIQDVAVRAFNQDFRLSDQNGALQWNVGAFFQHRRTLLDLLVDGEPGGVLPPQTVLLRSDQNDLSRAWAVYAQADYEFGNGYELSAAVRYDVDHRESEDVTIAGSAISHDFNAFQPQLTLRKRFTPDVLGYATFSRGFRSGGFNPLADVIVTGVSRLYPKETTTNYEIGLKSDLLDRRVSVNVALFHLNFENQQFFFANVNPPSRDIVTFPKTHINGGELEIQALPVEGLRLSAGLGYSDAIIDDYNGTGLYDRNHSPLSNRYTFNTSAQYSYPLAPGSSGLARVDYNGLGRVYYEPSDRFTFGPVQTLDARLGINARNWSVSLVGNNLTSRRFPTYISANAFGNDLSSRLPNVPRTYGVELSAKL